jgi:hypothetical protein
MVVHQAPTMPAPLAPPFAPEPPSPSSGPTAGAAAGAAGGHLHVEFYPPLRTETKLKYLAGSEQGAGTFISDVLPEESAAMLGEAILRAA